MIKIKEHITNSYSKFILNNRPPFYFPEFSLHVNQPPPRGCAGGRIGTRFLHPRGTSPLKGVNPTGTTGYRNGNKSFFSLKGHPSVVRDV